MSKHTPAPWAYREGEAAKKEMSTVFKKSDPEFLIGKITTVGKKCSNQSDAGTVTVGKVNIHTAHKSKHSK